MEAELKALILQKDNMEKEIESLALQMSIIDETKNFNAPLTDHEGFPRADIDFGELAAYRNLKRRKAELNNDHLALMKEIEKKLFAYHASMPLGQDKNINQTHESKGTAMNFKKEKKEQVRPEEKAVRKIDYLTPFAKVSIVFQGSPAQQAGLKVGDLLSEFEQINIYSLDWQKQLPGAVRQGQQIKIVVMRATNQEVQSQKQVFRLKDGNNYAKISLALTPNLWSGRGLLGCKIDPLSQ